MKILARIITITLTLFSQMLFALPLDPQIHLDQQFIGSFEGQPCVVSFRKSSLLSPDTTVVSISPQSTFVAKKSYKYLLYANKVPKYDSGCGISPKIKGSEITFISQSNAETYFYEGLKLTYDTSDSLKRVEFLSGGESFFPRLACAKFPSRNNKQICENLKPHTPRAAHCSYTEPSSNTILAGADGQNYCLSFIDCASIDFGGYTTCKAVGPHHKGCPSANDCANSEILLNDKSISLEQYQKTMCLDKKFRSIKGCQIGGSRPEP